MTTPDVIPNAPTTTLRRVQGTTITMTRSEPAPVVKVVDETVQPAHLKPVDTGKRKIEVMPGPHPLVLLPWLLRP